MTPETCPNCGADVPRSARACPECGSDEETGWSEGAAYGDLGTRDDFDYDRFVEREFGKKTGIPEGIHRFWWAITILLIAAFIKLFVL